ncbi:MAG: phosphoribosylanthranilate isomerase [Eubacteriales bacterium]|nr:phosphoribosylanthranilate isomerase [Eubacteriales bacterium]
MSGKNLEGKPGTKAELKLSNKPPARIKICGLSRPCDIDYVNEAKPDFAGFVINYPKSRRSVTPKQAAALRKRLRAEIVSVGVFVNEEIDAVAGLLNDGIIEIAQLHGQEDEAYIAKLRALTDKKIIQAFTVSSKEDVKRALKSSADYILLDNGRGTGAAFDWRLVKEIKRPWFLAGGLTPENIGAAFEKLHPWAADLSSGVETDGYKDREKILAVCKAMRRSERQRY